MQRENVRTTVIKAGVIGMKCLDLCVCFSNSVLSLSVTTEH